MPTQDARIGTFDGLDNRRWLLDGLKRLGHGLDEIRAGMVRARFLRSLLDDAEPQWRGKPLKLEPLSAVDAYMLCVAMMSGFGVPMSKIAERLEATLRGREREPQPDRRR